MAVSVANDQSEIFREKWISTPLFNGIMDTYASITYIVSHTASCECLLVEIIQTKWYRAAIRVTCNDYQTTLINRSEP